MRLLLAGLCAITSLLVIATPLAAAEAEPVACPTLEGPPPRTLKPAYTIPTIDLAHETHRQVIVDREKGRYLGHPTTVLLKDNRTMIAVYPKGHGGGAIVMKRSTDGGLTWSDRLPTPDNWATSQEVPTLYPVTDAKGVDRLIMFSGLYPIRMAVSEDDAVTWTPLKPIGDFGGIVAMADLVRLKDGTYMALFHDDGRFIRGGKGKHRDSPAAKRSGTWTVYKTLSADGGLTWSDATPIAEWTGGPHICEPGAVRSPDGRQIAVLLRENSRRFNSFVIFSDDEGRTWSKPRQVPAALTGDRHQALYAPDGRLVISFRDTTRESPTKGDWVMWVGTYDDIREGREGQYRVRLMDNHRSADCAYPALERLPDGTFVATTYGHWTAGEAPYIASVRFRIEEIDERAAKPGRTNLAHATGLAPARRRDLRAFNRDPQGSAPPPRRQNTATSANARNTAEANDRERLPRKMNLFTSGADGCHTYRIPSIIGTGKGTLLAFCEGRRKGRGDAGDIDLVMKRSTDGGATWGKTQVVWDDAGNTCGNPCPVIDRETGTIWLLMTWNLGSDHEGAIVAGTSKDTRRVFVTHSSDDGLTWAKPTDITKTTKRPDWTWYATGPGVGIQLRLGKHKGRMVIPCDHKVKANTQEYHSHVIWSDDGGKTWKIGGVAGDGGNECQVIERTDRTLYLNMRRARTRNDPYRLVATSTDAGATWSPLAVDKTLITPRCQASLLRYAPPDAKGKPIVLFSNPASTSGRVNMTVRASFDGGGTWAASKTLHAGPAAYSCLTVLPDGDVACFYEAGAGHPYEHIVLARFPLDWLTGAADPPAR